MPATDLSSNPPPSQELYRVVIFSPRSGNRTVTAVRMESANLSECVQELWHLVHHRGIPARMVDILALNPVGSWCSIWGDGRC